MAQWWRICLQGRRHSGEVGLISGSGRPTGKGNCSPLQDSYWENPLYRGDWWAMGHAVSESLIWLSDCPHTHTHTICWGKEGCRDALPFLSYPIKCMLVTVIHDRWCWSWYPSAVVFVRSLLCKSLFFLSHSVLWKVTTMQSTHRKWRVQLYLLGDGVATWIIWHCA